METTLLAAVRRALSGRISRRSLVAFAGGLVAIDALALTDDTEARKKGKGKKKRKNKKQKNAKAKTRTDARCSGPSDGSSVRPPEAGPRIAQTFIAQRGGQLVSAEISADKGPGSSGDLVLRLAPVNNSGLPTNNVLAEAVVANADLPEGPATIRFTFPNPFSVVAGTEYALVLTRFEGGGFAWDGKNFDPCAGRSFGSADQSQPFQESEGLDLIFTTFVKS